MHQIHFVFILLTILLVMAKKRLCGCGCGSQVTDCTELCHLNGETSKHLVQAAQIAQQRRLGLQHQIKYSSKVHHIHSNNLARKNKVSPIAPLTSSPQRSEDEANIPGPSHEPSTPSMHPPSPSFNLNTKEPDCSDPLVRMDIEVQGEPYRENTPLSLPPASPSG